MLTVVKDLHGDLQRSLNFIQIANELKPDIIVLEMLPKGPFDPQNAHRTARYFGTYYYHLAKILNEKFTVIGLEEPKHRAAELWKSVQIRALGHIEKDWARTLKPYKDKNILAFVGGLHCERLKEAFSVI